MAIILAIFFFVLWIGSLGMAWNLAGQVKQKNEEIQVLSNKLADFKYNPQTPKRFR